MGFFRHNTVVFAMCVPKGAATFTFPRNYVQKGQRVAKSRAVCALDAVINDVEGNLHYHDEEVG